MAAKQSRLAFGGLRRPGTRVRGSDVSGQVVEVGTGVNRLEPSDAVFGGCPASFAQYVCAGEDSFAPKRPNLTFEEAAALPLTAATALKNLRDIGQVRAGQKVLINGASGGVGMYAVQIAKSLGAEVTGVCSADLVRSLGADHVIDCTREDFTRGGRRYDLILDNVMNRSLSECRRGLASSSARGCALLRCRASRTCLSSRSSSKPER